MKHRKIWQMFLAILLLGVVFAGCASAGTKTANQNGSTSAPPKTEEASGAVKKEAGETKKNEEKGTDMPDTNLIIKVVANGKEIVFELNDTSVSRSFYAQLPLSVDVENYSNNEKIFQPPKKLDCSKAQEGACPVGTIAYFSPWNNVCLYYGDAPRYSGLYVMGKAVSGAEHIRNITGKAKIEAVTQ
jgi:hypothetical protein